MNAVEEEEPREARQSGARVLEMERFLGKALPRFVEMLPRGIIDEWTKWPTRKSHGMGFVANFNNILYSYARRMQLHEEN